MTYNRSRNKTQRKTKSLFGQSGFLNLFSRQGNKSALFHKTPFANKSAVLAIGLVAVVLSVYVYSSFAGTAMQSLWYGALPAHVSSDDAQTVELGLKFQASTSGYINGVKFYKGAGNDGIHSGSLWSKSGVRLASVTFTNETASGWQSALFASPVMISAGTTYVVSYLARRGHYAYNSSYFSKNSRVKGNLTALGGIGIANGVYKYGGGFPTDTYHSTNYWIDVLFKATISSTTPTPTVPTTSVATPTPALPATPTSVAKPTPALPAAPTPVVTPPLSSYGWQLTAAKTGLVGAGVNRLSLPVFSGNITPGLTIRNMKITTSLDLSSTANVTLDHVWLAPQAGGNIRALILGPGTTIVDSDIDGSMMDHSGEQIGIYGCVPVGQTYSINRVDLTGMTVGAWLDCDGNGSMVDTYIHGLVSNNGAHMDGFTRRAGIGQLTIARSRIDVSGASVTGALFLQSTWGGPIAGVLVTNSYLEGDGYVIGMSSGSNPGDITSAGFQNVRVRSTGWGPISTDHRVNYTSWTDVRQYDASRLPLADGAAIASQ